MRMPRGSSRSRARARARSVRARAAPLRVSAWSLHLLRAGQELVRRLEAGEAKLLLFASRGVDEDDCGNADDRIALVQLLHDRIIGVGEIGFDAREAVEILRHSRVAERLFVELLTWNAPCREEVDHDRFARRRRNRRVVLLPMHL